MKDEELGEYIPSYGERILIRNFCQRLQGRTKSRKQNLLTSLKKRFKLSQEQSDDAGPSGKPNVKTERNVEIGWLHFNEEEKRYVQVRARCGGGSRKVKFQKDGKKADLMEKGKLLFFPGSVSPKGNIDEFFFDVMDFKENTLNDTQTIGELYNQTMLPMLRFYLATKKKDIDKDEGPLETADLSDLDLPSVPSVAAQVEVPFEPEESDDSVIQFGPGTDEGEDNDDTLPYHTEPEKVTLIVRRNQVMEDLLSYFSESVMLKKEPSIRMVGLDGVVEQGVGDGVGRDCLTEFWSQFKDKCTTGASYKVPYLRHDFGQTKWEAIARLILYGWKKYGYFPIWLAPPFVEVAVCDNVLSSEAKVRDIFLDYISDLEKDVLSKALVDFDSVDFEDIIDALSSYNCRKIPTKANITSLIDEIAHKELIQEPMYVAKCFFPILNTLQGDLSKLEQIQTDLKPSAKKVLKLLQFPDVMTQPQATTSEYLKKYIKSLDQHHLALLLRFCTGSDLLIAPYITIKFIEQSDFTRRPIAHTCTFALDLPFTYDNFPQFRSEFNSILSSGMWVMDIE